MLSALILAFLGVPDETIVEDYALSAAAMVRLLERLKAEYPEAVEEVERYAPAVLQVCPRPWRSSWPRMRADTAPTGDWPSPWGGRGGGRRSGGPCWSDA